MAPTPYYGATNRDSAPVAAAQSDSSNHLLSRLEPFAIRKPPLSNSVVHSRGPISPPPLKRVSSAAPSSKTGSSPAPSDRASLANGGVENVREMTKLSGVAINGSPSRHATPPSSSYTRDRQPGVTSTPKAQTASATAWTVKEVAKRLKEFSQDVRDGHAQLVAYAIESTKPVERRIFHGQDLFAGVKSAQVQEKKGNLTMRIKFKQHFKAKKDHREGHYMAVCIKTNKEAVPSYRFHHVEIKKNVLTPNTMLTFVPHLRDLESSEEATYNLWLKELEDIDLKSGFKPMNREEKHTLTVQLERAATISLYLDSWLDTLAIPHCNKSTLIRCMASKEPDDAMTPQQKTDIIKWHSDGNDMTAEAQKAAEMFTAAFQLAFKEGQPVSKQIDLRKVLRLDESVDSIMDNKSAAKEISNPQHDNEDDVAESNLATYGIFGCLICFSHSCDHGEYDNKNWKRTFSLSSCFGLSDVLKKKRASTSPFDGITETPCQRKCHRLGVSSHWDTQPRPWSDDERVVLRSLLITADRSKVRMDPICLAAEFLNRNCCEVYAEFLSLGISIPEPKPTEIVRPKNIPWYDRRKKALQGDWQEHTISHEHQRREILEPCFHEGPCAPRVCTCVDAGVLCEKFCGCTVESCSYKFTGCACHAQGKTCYSKQKDKPCICVQLNRECDPELCGSCGALERADPANADDHFLHSTGCQNCEMQRGVHKSLLLGQSQLEGVGYGLFTAEDIAQDEFIIEYVGELITHDEGVRREARRGDVFDEESNISYLFTLLENEGIWVDAAIYGNLSRYINHASEHDTWGCNITPRILYVNGEYRIKFTALRDIKAGEELFFNYGENFPNLTKKLLDHKAGEKPEAAAKGKAGRSRRAETGDRVARKAPKTEHAKVGRPRTKKKAVEPGSDDENVDVGRIAEQSKVHKRKRRMQDDSEEEEYHPTGTDGTSHAAESGVDSEDVPPGSARRLRKRPKKKEPDTPSKNRNQPKTRGKRGGARPGSGRPRKHPRPDPPPAAKAAQEAQAAQAAPVPSGAPVASTAPAAPAAGQAPAVPVIITTPKQDKTQRQDPIDVIEIEDSEDQDVVVRNRTVRNRRPPAKFRDEEAWNNA